MITILVFLGTTYSSDRTLTYIQRHQLQVGMISVKFFFKFFIWTCKNSYKDDVIGEKAHWLREYTATPVQFPATTSGSQPLQLQLQGT